MCVCGFWRGSNDGVKRGWVGGGRRIGKGRRGRREKREERREKRKKREEAKKGNHRRSERSERSYVRAPKSHNSLHRITPLKEP